MIEFPRNSLIDALGRLVVAGFVVVRRSSVPALIVMVSGGVRLAPGAFVLGTVEPLVTVFVARVASDSRLFGRRVGARETATLGVLRDFLQVLVVDDDGVRRGARARGSVV